MPIFRQSRYYVFYKESDPIDPQSTEDLESLEGSFGQPIDEPTPEDPGVSAGSVVRDKIQDKIRQSRAKPKTSPLPAAKPVSKQAVQSASQAAVNTGAKVAAQAGTRAATAAAGLAAGPAGWLATAATVLGTVAEAFRSNQLVRRIAISLILFFILIIGALFLGFAGYQTQCNQPGPSPRGGNCLRPQTAPFEAAVAANASGLTVSSQIEDLDRAREQIIKIIDRNTIKLSASQVSQVKDLLNQMHALRAEMKSSAYAFDKQYIAQKTKEYNDLMLKAYGVIYPGYGPQKARVVTLITNKTINFPYSKCAVKRDIYERPLSPKLLNLIASAGEYAAQNNFTLSINCLMSGHDPGTFHEKGMAVDLHHGPNGEIANKLVPYLFDNRDALDIDELFFMGPVQGKAGSAYSIDRGVSRPGMTVSNHRDHIHVAVQP